MVIRLVPEISSSNNPVWFRFCKTTCGRGAHVCLSACLPRFSTVYIYRWGKKHATLIVTHYVPAYCVGQPIRQDVWVIYPQLCNTFSVIFAYIVAVHISKVYWRPCRLCGLCVCTHSALNSARSKNLGLLGTVILVAVIYFKLPFHR
jgi:hypothetical protein